MILDLTKSKYSANISSIRLQLFFQFIRQSNLLCESCKRESWQSIYVKRTSNLI